jgi:hypothetical protein
MFVNQFLHLVTATSRLIVTSCFLFYRYRATKMLFAVMKSEDPITVASLRLNFSPGRQSQSAVPVDFSLDTVPVPTAGRLFSPYRRATASQTTTVF